MKRKGNQVQIRHILISGQGTMHLLPDSDRGQVTKGQSCHKDCTDSWALCWPGLRPGRGSREAWHEKGNSSLTSVFSQNSPSHRWASTVWWKHMQAPPTENMRSAPECGGEQISTAIWGGAPLSLSKTPFSLQQGI